MHDTVSVKLSAAVMVYNGINTVRRCIESLRFCDEIVVVDDCSTDGTWEYLHTADVKAFRRRHTTFADQRAFARDRCKGDWLLTMDADEYVTNKLRDQILKAIASADKHDGFYITRRNPYPTGLHGVLWSSHPRLIRTSKCRWIPTENPHSPLDKKGLKLGVIKNAFLDHEPVDGIATQMRKSINRSILLAKQEHASGKRAGVFRLTFSCLVRFIKIFFLKGGIRYGRSGFIVACLDGFEAFCKYALLISKRNPASHIATDGGVGSYPRPEPGKKEYV